MIDHVAQTKGVDVVEVKTFCVACDEPQRFEMPMSQYQRWQMRQEPIQNIFPEMIPADREVLLSGTCGDCFAKVVAFWEQDE